MCKILSDGLLFWEARRGPEGSGTPPPLHIQTVKDLSLQCRRLGPVRPAAAGMPEFPL